MSNTSEPAVCCIIPYYGKWPEYFNFFLKSSQWNTNINFVIFTDLSLPSNCPANVHKVHLSFEDLKLLIEEKLTIDIELNNPYKLCDFKPAYGLIFQEWVKEYQYWGYGDIDVIF